MNKLKFLLIAVLVMAGGQGSAQWIVNDPSNLMQNLINSTNEISQTSAITGNTLRNFEQTVRIYNENKSFFDALKNVNIAIKNGRRVVQTLQLVGDVSEIYVSNYRKIIVDPNFSTEEKEAIAGVYSGILDDCGGLVTDLQQVISNSHYQMNDRERLTTINEIYDQMLENRNVAEYFTRKQISLSYIRAGDKREKQRVNELYGTFSQRYD